MRQETLFRGLVDCLVSLGQKPWGLVFDNMNAVTSGCDATGQPIWTPALVQLAGEFGFHPQACDPGAANQEGSVESLVKWVKGNFLAGRRFANGADLAEQLQASLGQVNARPSSATGEPPLARLLAEAAQGGVLPHTALDFGLFATGQVSSEAIVAVTGNRYLVPVAHVGAPVTVPLHRERVRIWQDLSCIADHPRAADGSRQRAPDPAHFAALFPHTPRAQAMLPQEVLLGLGGAAPAFLAGLSRHQRGQFQAELLAVYALYEQVGAAALLTAMARAELAGHYSAAALVRLLSAPNPAPCLLLPGVPAQAEVDRALSVYERQVQIDVVRPEVAS